MESATWKVELSPQCAKQVKKLPLKVKESFFFFLKEMEKEGPWRKNWPNYTTLHKTRKVIPENSFHCHIQKGNPTYVVCWEVIKKTKTARIFYAGTHEGSPYQK